jgi:hypothetical protein
MVSCTEEQPQQPAIFAAFRDSLMPCACASLAASLVPALCATSRVSSGFEAQLRQWADSLQHQYTRQHDSAGGWSGTLVMIDGVFRLWSLLLSAFWKEVLIVLVCMCMPAFKGKQERLVEFRWILC